MSPEASPSKQPAQPSPHQDQGGRIDNDGSTRFYQEVNADGGMLDNARDLMSNIADPEAQEYFTLVDLLITLGGRANQWCRVHARPSCQQAFGDRGLWKMQHHPRCELYL